MISRPFRPTLLLCCALALVGGATGCTPRSGGESGAIEQKETYYFDAERGFAIEYPSDWKIERGIGRPPESCTVRWQSPAVQGSAEPAVEAEVIACPISLWPGGLEAMRAEFLAEHESLTLSADKSIELPGGKGTMLIGEAAKRTRLAVFLLSENRGYRISFTTPSADFETYRPLFDEMLESFTPLEGR